MEGVILALTTPSEFLKTVEVEKVPASLLQSAGGGSTIFSDLSRWMCVADCVPVCGGWPHHQPASLTRHAVAPLMPLFGIARVGGHCWLEAGARGERPELSDRCKGGD